MFYLMPSAKEMKTGASLPQQDLSMETDQLIHILGKQTVEELAVTLKLKPEQAAKEYQRFQALSNGEAPAYPALMLFNGLMYRQIDPEVISREMDFIHNHLFITTALYGIIPALSPIHEHRLDFMAKLKVDGKSLKQFWRAQYDAFAEDHQPIVSLLSSEFEDVFSPSYRKNFIRLAFMEDRNGTLKTHSTISKKARGAFISAIIDQHIDSLDALKQLEVTGFTYRDDLSDEQQLTFVKA